MITLPSKFAAENAKAEKTPAIIVKLLESELIGEETTQADWTANTGESNVDYTTTPGDVVLSSQAESYTGKTAWTQRYDHASVNVGGIMYTLGGVIALVDPKTAIETWAKYDISTDTWTALPVLSGRGSCGHTLVSDGSNLIYLTGGRNTRSSKLASVIYLDHRVYNITTATWTVLAAPPIRIFDSAAVYYNGKIYVAGGRTDDGTAFNTFYVYDVATDAWSTLSAMPRTFDRHTMVLWADGGVAGQLVVYGGNKVTAVTDETWIYDIDTDSWAQGPSGATARFAHAAAIIADRMVIVGGKLNTSGYMADLWELDLSNMTWIQRTSGSHVYARHTVVANGSTLIIHAGRDSTQTFFDTVSYQAVIFQATGWLQTQTVDLGVKPTVDGELIFKDIRPTGTTLVYEGWKSATGAFTGEEVYVGFLVDGQVVTAAQAERWFRIKTTLTADTGGLNSPTVQSIKVSFSTYRSYSDTTGFGYEPAVFNVSSLTTTIDTFKPSTIGQMTVTLAFISSVSDYLKTKNPKNKIVKILAGFKADGFTELDFIDYFWGQIDDWSITNKDEVTLTVKDYKKEWSVDVPASWNSTVDDVVWTAQHPADVILDILQNQINVRDSKIDISSFTILKNALPGWVVTRTITGNPEQADALIEELRGVMSAVFIPQSDGKISIKRFDPLEASVQSLTDKNIFNKSWTANGGSLINNLFVYSDWDGVGGDTSAFADLRVAVDVTSQTNYDELATKEIKDKWTRQDAHDLFTNGNFETGNTTGWTLAVNTGAGAAATFAAAAAATPYQGSWKGVVSITNGGAVADDVLIKQTGMSITNGHEYKITFGVKANVNHSMDVKFRRGADPFLSYTDDPVQTISVTPTYTLYTVKYTANVTASDLAVYFLLGFGPTSVEIDVGRMVDMALEQTDDMTAAILARYAIPPEKVTLDVDASLIALEVGDIVDLTTVRAPSSDMAGVSALKMQIVNIRMDFKKRTSRMTFLRV